MIPSRHVYWVLAGIWTLALVAAAIGMRDSGWAQFGSFLAESIRGWKTGSYRRLYLAHWVLPMLLAYTLMLCGGIFLGLRRLRKGAR